MTDQINLDAINADIQAIETMFEKYQVDPETAYDFDSINVEFPKYYRLENLIDELEELGHIADMFSNGFYKVLLAARLEVNRLNGSYQSFFRAEE